MLKDHITIGVVATLVCDLCDDAIEAEGSSEREAERICLEDAETEKWSEFEGRVYCGDCNG